MKRKEGFSFRITAGMVIIKFLLLVILSYLGAHFIRRYVERHEIMDIPNERSSHSIPIPRGGGLVIVALVMGVGLLSITTSTETSQNAAEWAPGIVYLVCGLVIALLGWQDDVRSLSKGYRFLIQGIVAVVSMYGLGYFKAVTIPLFGEVQLGIAGILITFLWIVGLINAYNFMDGIDGIAGGVAFAGGLGWMLLASHMNNPFVFWIALAIAASSLGFLGHNWSPAKIFMGDVASTFLGYTFAVLPLLSSDESGDALLLGTLLMWTFIMDASVTFIWRGLEGKNIFDSHREHLYQRLVDHGYKHSTISLLYILLTLLAGILSYAWSWGNILAPVLILLGLPLIWILLSRHASSLTLTTKATTLAPGASTGEGTKDS